MSVCVDCGEGIAEGEAFPLAGVNLGQSDSDVLCGACAVSWLGADCPRYPVNGKDAPREDVRPLDQFAPYGPRSVFAYADRAAMLEACKGIGELAEEVSL